MGAPDKLSSNLFAFIHGILNPKSSGIDMKALDQRTLGSALYRKYITVDKDDNIHITDLGYQAYLNYVDRDIPQRKKVSDLSDLVNNLLHLKSNQYRKASNLRKIKANHAQINSTFINQGER